MHPESDLRPNRSRTARIASRLWLPAALALAAGLVLLLVGILTMSAEVQSEAGYNTEAVGAPAYAALFTVWGPVPGRPWLIAGVVATVPGGIATLCLLARSRRRAVGRNVPRRIWGVTALVLGIGIALLLVGLIQVPRDLFDVVDVVDMGLDLPGDDGDARREALERATPPLDVPGRGSLDLGTGLVAIGAALLLGSGVARRRGIAGSGSQAATAG